MHRKRFSLLNRSALWLPATQGGRVRPYLLDNFGGSGTLAAHTPDRAPAGAAWSVVSGAFNNLSGGYASSSTVSSVATINVGQSDYIIRCRAKVFNTTWYGSGIYYRITSGLSGNSAYLYYDAGRSVLKVSDASCLSWGLAEQIAGNIYQIPVTAGGYFNINIVVRGTTFMRVIDDNGTPMLGTVKPANSTNTYIGLCCAQANGNWDWIKVEPINGLPAIKGWSLCGDSISDDASEWPGQFTIWYNDHWGEYYNHAVSGSTILSQMAYQAGQCVADKGEFTIVALGTNDSPTLSRQTIYHDALHTLWNGLHKPIYCMGVLPKDPSGNRDFVNGYIQSAVADAAGDGVNCTYWNTDGWIDPTIGVDTTDGLHPNGSGQAKITAQVRARLG